ncbi:MAG TPA: hypothetical protein VF121_00865 [Thermoanaerobaculia bacterium]|nr:hypothetical protein [Thermoanaerobaculia bacterium]
MPRLLVAVCLAFAAVAGTLRLRAYDTFWHLAAGRWILAHQRVPRFDPFRFTSENTPWVDHEWLFQVWIAVLERLGGVSALVVARTLLVAGIAALLLRELRRAGAPLAGAVLVVVVAVLGARGRFFLRPELASLAGVVLLLALLQRVRRVGRAGWREVAPLAGLVVLWVNLHPGALLAPLLAAAYLLGARVPWRTVVTLPAIAALALLANPYGAKVFTVPFGIAAGLRGLPAVNPEWLPVWRAPLPHLLFGAAALVVLAALTAVRARRLDAATGLAALFLAALAATAVRHQGLFFLGAAFFAGECLADLRRATPPVSARPARALAPVVALAACALAALWCVRPPASGPLRPRQGRLLPGLGLEPGRFPENAVDRLERLRGVGRLYNDVAFGGYLLWRLYPPRRVFIDSRNEVRPDLLHELARARADERAWRALLDRYRIDAALVRNDRRLRPLVTLDAAGRPARVEHLPEYAVLFPRDRFALVYADEVALLFLRRTAARAAAGGAITPARPGPSE